jgi:hypothetical protein
MWASQCLAPLRSSDCFGRSDDSNVGAACPDQDGWPAANKISGEFRKTIDVAIRPPIFDRDVLTLNKSSLIQPLREHGNEMGKARGGLSVQKADQSVCCCARATSGHADTTPAIPMNSRRLIASPELEHGSIVPAQTGRPEVVRRRSGGMSALGQKQTLHRSNGTSALPPKADIVLHGGNVRFVPKADIDRSIRSSRRRETAVIVALKGRAPWRSAGMATKARSQN